MAKYKLTENKLRGIIREAVKNALTEEKWGLEPRPYRKRVQNQRSWENKNAVDRHDRIDSEALQSLPDDEMRATLFNKPLGDYDYDDYIDVGYQSGLNGPSNYRDAAWNADMMALDDRLGADSYARLGNQDEWPILPAETIGEGIEKYTDDMYKDLENSYKKDRDKMRRADKRWEKSSDKRTLHRKGAAQRDLMDDTNESVLRNIVREAVSETLMSEGFGKTMRKGLKSAGKLYKGAKERIGKAYNDFNKSIEDLTNDDVIDNPFYKER